ncbi:hypothetical protein BDZ91DRAFT_786637 [Kalaharituber pfeilii]|nr:hypothetical protein BDZ91DRAFT_786637 [Kalaharituber pfeilii]
MEAATALNFDILRSQFFKITLGEKLETQSNDGANEVFYAHRELLAKLSPELRKHVDNDMKEGLSGEMILRDVDKETMCRFLQWAYVKEYSIDSGTQETNATSILLPHVKLYALADRFNIQALKELSLQKLTSFLTDQSKPDTIDLLSATRFAIENLPTLTERVVEYLLGYTAWLLPDVRDQEDFTELIQAHPDAAVALFRLTRRAEQAPCNPCNKSSEGENAVAPEITGTCGWCGAYGNMKWVYCTNCGNVWRAMYWNYADRHEKRCQFPPCRLKESLRYRCGNQNYTACDYSGPFS